MRCDSVWPVLLLPPNWRASALKTGGRVVVAGRVAKERSITNRGIVLTGSVVSERTIRLRLAVC